MDAYRKTLGRVAVDRAIRLRVEPSPADGRAERRSSAANGPDFLCARCGAVICAADRVRLFRGIVLKCTACGEANRCAAGGPPRAASGSM